MVAGLIGPAGWREPPSLLTSSRTTLRSLGRPVEPDGTVMDASEEGAAGRANRAGLLFDGPDYRKLFGNAFVEDAVLRMMCQAAQLNGLWFGDNQANPEVTTEAEAKRMAQLARELVDTIQVLLGEVHNTKLHRFAHHLLQELRNVGNLWEGDTSLNESAHASLKAMFRRTNRVGRSLMLQILWAAETQTDVLKAFNEEERADDRDADLSAAAQEVAAAAAGGDVGEQDDDTTQQLRTSKRGVTVSLAAVAERPGLAGLANALGVPPTSTALMVNTIIKHAVFEWGAPSERQHVRGSVKFRGAPWFSHIRYKDAEGETQWGMVKVVLRAVAGVRRPCVVVQCLRRADAHRGCVLTKFGCQRLEWDFVSPDDEWPRLEAVELSAVLRLEQVHIDWRDLVGRHDLLAMPSTQPRTAEERRATRFFTNAFYPWTTRAQRYV